MKGFDLQTIVYLGPEGSYTEIAAEKIAHLQGLEKFNPIIKSSIIKVIETVDSDNGFIAVVPIENSIEGIVRETLDNLITATSRVTISKEVIIPISHCLISKSKELSSVKKIMSIPQALAQCQHFIANNFSNIEIIPTTSTSEAVKSLMDLPENYAAIGSCKAANIYKMNIIAEEINDIKDNMTRFACLSPTVPPPTGNDKTSIAFSAHNKAGTLVSILNAFSANGINLSYIESRPSKKVFGDYNFFMDFDGHIEDENVQKTVGKIAPLISFYKFLGSYPKEL